MPASPSAGHNLSAIVTAHHVFTSAERYELKNGARNGNGSEEGGDEYEAKLKQAMDAAWAGKFSVLIVWALDGLTRQVSRMPCA